MSSESPSQSGSFGTQSDDYAYGFEEEDDHMGGDSGMGGGVDLGGAGGGGTPAAGQSGHAGEQAYETISPDSLKSAQQDEIERVRSMLDVEAWQARALLIHYRWDIEALTAIWTDRGEEDMFKAAGVACVRDTGKAQEPLSQPNRFTCEICGDEAETTPTTRSPCGHEYCDECWTGHILVKVADGKSRRVGCMGFKCPYACPERQVLGLVRATGKVEIAEKYELSLEQSYVEDNARVAWCPSVPHCGNALRAPPGAEEGVPGEPACACGERFCFSCNAKPHSPASCDMWQKWGIKSNDESETMNWLVANTKPCPKCAKSVEKNGGCNLVMCRCGQAFCWLCGQATGAQHTWTTITGHNCGAYEEEVVGRARSAAENLKRYMHFYTRWKAHMDSAGQENTLAKKLEARIGALEDRAEEAGQEFAQAAIGFGGAGASGRGSGSGSVANADAAMSSRPSTPPPTMVDFSWLHDGLRQLTRSRGMLANTYVFAFYAFGDLLDANEAMSDNERASFKGLFEDNQSQMELAVEQLSGLLEAQPGELGAKTPRSAPAAPAPDDKGKGKGKAGAGAGAFAQPKEPSDLESQRQKVINLSVSCDLRCVHMFDYIDSEVLERLATSQAPHAHAPYVPVYRSNAVKVSRTPSEGGMAAGSGAGPSTAGGASAAEPMIISSDADKSDSEDGGSGGAKKRKRRSTRIANTEGIDKLLGMGFDKTEAQNALQATLGDVDEAAALLAGDAA